jgi:predicted SAM-dependent methyltransferase
MCIGLHCSAGLPGLNKCCYTGAYLPGWPSAHSRAIHNCNAGTWRSVTMFGRLFLIKRRLIPLQRMHTTREIKNVAVIDPPDPVVAKMRHHLLANYTLLGRRGVEIGPLSRPLISRGESEVYYVDHCSTEELKIKYRGDPNVQQEKIAAVDFVWTDRPLAETLGAICPVDYIVASHVIEHVPDLIGWLKEMHDSLRDGGSLILIVPDKRITFDAQRRTSAYEEVRLAYQEKRRRPGLRCIMDHFANVVQADCYKLWDNYEIVNDLPFVHSAAFLTLAAEHYQEGRYIDVHCWVFTPWSFLETLGRIAREENLNFDLEYFKTTQLNDLEFYVRLVRVPSPTTDWAEVARQAQVEAFWPKNQL